MATSDEDGNRQFILELYRCLLAREPEPPELSHWVAVAQKGMPDRELFNRFVTSSEYQAKTDRVKPAHPLGHYYSPVVDPATLCGACRPHREIQPDAIAGIELPLPMMTDWWHAHLEFLKATPFPDEDDGRHRYFARNAIYPLGDAAVLRAMVLAERPREIVEIGSGFSSACILDTIEEGRLETTLTCIDPHMERLRSRLRPRDARRLRIIERPVQEVPLDEFSHLESDSIVVIDSSHVLKTGSDVNYELFAVLPALRDGVLIHFHDIGYPFEYPDRWIFEMGYSWNEAYAVRAFLMHNERYRVEFWTSMFSRMAADLIAETFPRWREHPNASLWLRKGGSRERGNERDTSPAARRASPARVRRQRK